MEVVLSLGETPLANALLRHEDLDKPERRYPLDLAFCPRCSLVQITETVPPEELFCEYPYFSSFSDTMLTHAEALASRLRRTRDLSQQSLVIEVASNDGYLLQYYQRDKIPVLGIEPARNVARVAIEERGIPTVTEFFGLALARDLASRGERADILHANNVLAHVADLNGFAEGMATVLKDDGLAVVEVPYLGELVDRCEFDTIYHEHLCYFSLGALRTLFGKHGLVVADVERLLIHGGSLRVFATKQASFSGESQRVAELVAQEEQRGLCRLDYYQPLAPRVEKLRGELRGFLGGLKSKGKKIAAYGAAAKGSTLLNYLGIGRETLDFVADRSTYKQGRYTPGVHLRIEAPAALLEHMPDYVLLLTWNFKDEILEQQAEYRRRGGRFIVPIPEVLVV